MIDTVKLRSPELPEGVAVAIERLLVLRRAIDGPTGEVLYELVSGPLVGSYDHRISCTVKRERWVREALPWRWDAAGRRRKPVVMVQEPCAPYVEVEGSVHKAMLGHNLEGGCSDPLAVCSWFVAFLARGFGVELPPAAVWEVRRIDQAEVFALDYAGCEAYVRGLALADYPRRRIHRYGDETVFFPGSTTAIKVYHKGPEFSKHDRARLRGVVSSEVVAALQWRANKLLRVEVEIKARKLDTDFQGPPTVGQLTESYITDLFDREIAKMLREGETASEIVRTAEAVLERLYARYSAGQASALYGTWLKFAAHGEKVTRRKMTDRTFYDHRKKLAEAGVSWHGADVAIVQAGPIPLGFSPIRSDLRRVVGEDPRVVELLAPYRAAVA
jgi:II/X family phage/plasmid replication protein